MTDAVEHPRLPYREEDGVTLIEISLDSPERLFNSLDPAPFVSKDLDPDAEQYILGAADDLPLRDPLKIIVYLPGEYATVEASREIAGAIHHYFAYMLSMSRRRLHATLREGRMSLLIGLAFLFGCVSLRQVVLLLGTGTLAQIIAEGVLISGWVAMWRPLHIFLYEWWPIRRVCRLQAKLSTMPVDVRPLQRAE